MIGFPIWYLTTEEPYSLIVEILAPWFVGLVSLSFIPLLLVVYIIIAWPFYYIRNEWREWNHD